MANLKVYNESTGEWEYLVVGKQGPTGPQGPSGVITTTSPITNSGTSTSAVLGLDYDALSYGHNYIINGAFDIWQRGDTTGSITAGFSADRWQVVGAGQTVAVTKRSFTPGDIEAIGFGDAENYLEFDITANDGFCRIVNRIEDVRTLAGQEVTLSFWAKADAAQEISVRLVQTPLGSSAITKSSPRTLSTSWQRFQFTVTLDSLSGATINAGSYLEVGFWVIASDTPTIDIWGWQLEAGSVATPFKRHAPSLQGELAACQRYYERLGGVIAQNFGDGHYYSTTSFQGIMPYTTKRVNPTITVSGATEFTVNSAGSGRDSTAIGFVESTTFNCRFAATTAAATLGDGGYLRTRSATPGFVEISAEL